MNTVRGNKICSGPPVTESELCGRAMLQYAEGEVGRDSALKLLSNKPEMGVRAGRYCSRQGGQR